MSSLDQCAKKVVFYSQGRVDFAIGLVDSDSAFLGIQFSESLKQIVAMTFFWEGILFEMTLTACPLSKTLIMTFLHPVYVV